MEANAKVTFVRIAPRKVKIVLDLIVKINQWFMTGKITYD